MYQENAQTNDYREQFRIYKAEQRKKKIKKLFKDIKRGK